MSRINLKLWNFRIRRILVVALVAPLITSISTVAPQQAFAAAIGSGICVQDVGNIAGVSVTQSGNDCIVIFTNTTSTTWKAPTGVSTVRYLVVGAGASGDRGVCGVHWGHGGGGGQVRAASLGVTPGTSYTVAVGSGGQGSENAVCPSDAPTVANAGFNGSLSQFGSITAAGGLRAVTKSTVGGASGEGFAGGTGTGTYPAGGGGGAGGVGNDINGGLGINSDITGSTIMYGSGGAGKNNSGFGTASSGGATGTDGPIANRGGGGADRSPGWHAGANGVVIIRYTAFVPITFPQVAYNPTTLSVGAGVGGRSDTFTATGGAGTRTFSLTPVRSGFSIDTSTANGAALVVSSLVATGTYLETITVTDAAGFSVNHVVTVTVAAPVKWSVENPTSLTTTYGTSASVRLNITGGTSGRVVTLTKPTTVPLNGITIDTSTAISSNYVTLNVSTRVLPGTYSLTVSVIDSSRIRSNQVFTVTVNKLPALSFTSGTAETTTVVRSGLHLQYEIGQSYSGSGTTVLDLSGNNRNGTIVANSPYSASLGGGSVAVNGTNFLTTRPGVINNADTLSRFYWIYPRSVTQTILTVCDSACAYVESELELFESRLYARVWNLNSVSTQETLTLNTWHYIGYVYDPTAGRTSIYINGQLSASGANSGSRASPGEQYEHSGRATTTRMQTTEPGNYSLGSVHYYKRVLTDAEIFSNYAATAPRFIGTAFPGLSTSGSATITTTQGVTSSHSLFTATEGTGGKVITLSSATAGVTLDTATANSAILNIANTVTATNSTTQRTISTSVVATDSVTATTTYPLTLRINPPVLISASIPLTLSTTFGRVAYDTFTATQGTGNKTFTGVSSAFPSAFTVSNPSANVGLLTVAATLPAGTYLETITATDSVGATTNYVLTVVVNPAPTIAGATGNTLTTTLARSATLRINVVGGTGTRTIAWTSPQAGITLDTSTLAAQNFITLSASSAVPVRSYSFSIAATDSSSARVSDTFTVVVNRWPVIGSDSVVQNGLAVNLEASTYSGTGNWLDTSGAGRNASGATASTTPAGTAPEYSTESGGIFSFNEGAATTNHMLIPNPGTLETFTVSTWVRFKSIPTNNAAIITQYWPGGSNTINYVLGFSGGSIYGAYYRGSSNWTTTTTLFTPVINTWYHLSYLVYKSGANYFQDLYVNGVKQGASDNAGTIAPSSNGSVISLARRWDFNANVTLNGAYGNVSIYNRALSASEILQNYNATGARYISTNSGRETITVTQGVSGAISSVLATQGIGTKTFTTTNASAGITIDTATANAFTLNLANNLTSTSATVARTITETVTATDAAGATTARVYSIIVNPPVRVESTTGTITTTSGIVAWDTFTATQGTGLKTFTLTGTPSTSGFTLTQANNQAVLKIETTVNPGTYTLTITATDEVGAVASITKTVVVNAQPTISGFANIAGTTGYAFSSQNYSAANGTGTLTFSITTVPFTLGRNTSGITLSAIVGSPTINVASGVEADTYTVTVRVTDSVTAFGTFVVTLRVNPVATLSGSRSLTKVYGEDLSQVYTTSGGTQPFNLFSSSICTSEKSTFVGNGTNGSNGVTYTVEKFNGTGDCSWVAPANVSNASILVVAGGGGGGSRHSGGGGGGGVMYATNYSLTPGSSYALSVGNGGTGYVGGTSSGSGNSGQNSFFGGSTGSTSIVATGGGGSNANGGSGGGSNYHLSAGGTATPGSTAGTARSAGSSTMTINGVVATVIAHGQSGAVGLGNTCKTVSNSNGWCGGGGGGASSAGSIPATVSGNQFRAGNGGNGVALDFTGSSTTYAGGGGGGAGSDTSPYGSASACFSDSPREGYGGTGGGGNGSKCLLAAANGSDGLGGGGGGGGYAYYGDNNQNARGGNGGSGTVIVRYVTPAVDTQTARITMDTLAQTPAGLVRLNAPRLLAVGTYTQTITVRDSALNPVTTNATVTLTVSKATPTLTLSLPGAVITTKYGSPVTISAVATTAGTVAFVNGSSNITGCTAVATSAGLATCSWTPTAVGATTLRATLTPTDTANYNSSTQVNLAITVAKADTLTVTVLSQSETFTGSTIVATRAFTTTGLATIDSLTAISMLFAGTANDGNAYSNTTAPTNAGTYSITPNYPANAAAYTFGVGSAGTTSAITNYESVTVVSGTLTVRRAPQVMSFTFANSNTVTYSPTATLASTATTRLGTGTQTYSTTTPLTCSINETATITVLQAGSCSAQMAVALTANYEADTATRVITVNKASRTFVLTPATATLKFAETTTVTATLSGGAADGTISYTLGSPAGCTFDPLTGELLAISGTIQCPLTATISEGVNYLAETTTAMALTIARATAPVITLDTVTALNHIPNTRASITPNFTITGLKNLDAAASVTYTYGFVSNPFETFAYSDTRTPIDAGTYSITPSALTLSSGLIGNYETPTYASSAINVVINRISQETVTIQSVNGEVDVPFALFASGGSTSGTLSFTKVSGDYCSVSGITLTATQAGSCVVTVTRPGDRNYLAYTSASVSVKVRNFVIVVFVVPANTDTGITIAPSVPVVKGPDVCTSGCVPTIASADVYDVVEGDLIVLTGTNFLGVTKVYFNIYTEAPNFIADSDTQISVRVPADLPQGDATIEVVSPGGTSNRHFDFIILP
jgi:hypothetical protein